MAITSSEYKSFNTPITTFLSEGSDLLTDAAKQLLEGDLIAIAWKNQTPRTIGLTTADLFSIEQAFQKNSLYGDQTVAGACCCCTCTPACCCTAVAVIQA
jgi:hypothetical protein